MASRKNKKHVVASSSFRSIAHALPFILVAVFVVFSPALSNEFVNWDDYDYIVNNPLIKTFDITNILHLFNFNTQVPGNYHPLTILSYSLEYQFAGDRPFRYHFDNILLHLTNTVLFSVFAWKLIRPDGNTYLNRSKAYFFLKGTRKLLKII